MSDSLTPTSASAWRSPRREGFSTVLPSGQVVRMKRTLDLPELLKQGRIPNPLAGFIRKAMAEGTNVLDWNSMDETTRIQTVAYLNSTICRSVIDPPIMDVPEGENRLTWEAPEGSISIEDLSWDDRLFIFQAANGGAADVEQFRLLQKKLLESLSNGTDVARPSVKPAGAERA